MNVEYSSNYRELFFTYVYLVIQCNTLIMEIHSSYKQVENV